MLVACRCVGFRAYVSEGGDSLVSDGVALDFVLSLRGGLDLGAVGGLLAVLSPLVLSVGLGRGLVAFSVLTSPLLCLIEGLTWFALLLLGALICRGGWLRSLCLGGSG